MYHHDLEEDYLTLFVSETINSVSGVEWYHCSLSLVDAFDVEVVKQITENKEEELLIRPRSNRSIRKQIHIENNGNGLFTYVELNAVTTQNFNQTEFYPLLSEPESDLKVRWELFINEFEAFEKGLVKFGLNLRFNEAAANCRTAVRDALRKEGMELYPEYTKSIAGLYASRLLPYR